MALFPKQQGGMMEGSFSILRAGEEEDQDDVRMEADQLLLGWSGV